MSALYAARPSLLLRKRNVAASRASPADAASDARANFASGVVRSHAHRRACRTVEPRRRFGSGTLAVVPSFHSTALIHLHSLTA